jgi:hypothetical protein
MVLWVATNPSWRVTFIGDMTDGARSVLSAQGITLVASHGVGTTAPGGNLPEPIRPSDAAAISARKPALGDDAQHAVVFPRSTIFVSDAANALRDAEFRVFVADPDTMEVEEVEGV